MTLSEISIGTAFAWLVAAAGSVVVLMNLWNAVAAKLKPHKDKEKSIEDRLNAHQTAIEQSEKHFAKIDEILAEQQRTNGVIFRAIFDLINRDTSGTDDFSATRTELQNYLTNRK